MKFFLYAILIVLLIAPAFAQQNPSNINSDNNEDSLADNSAKNTDIDSAPDNSAKVPQTQKNKIVVKILCNFKKYDIHSTLVKFGKEIEEKYQGSIELQFVNIDKNQKALKIWESLRKLKSNRFRDDAICIIKDRFILGLSYIEKLLPDFIDYELDPKNTFDPLHRKIVRSSDIPVKEPAKQTNWKSNYKILLYLIIILIPLILGFVISYLIFNKKKVS